MVSFESYSTMDLEIQMSFQEPLNGVLNDCECKLFNCRKKRDMLNLPFELTGAIESGNCVLFLGAGVGKHLYKPDGKNLPTGAELASKLAGAFNIDCNGCTDLRIVSKLVEIARGREELISFLQNELVDVEPDESFVWLFENSWKAIYTTNYDLGIERAFKMKKMNSQKCIPITISRDICALQPSLSVPVIYLHGKLAGENASNIVITSDDYMKYREERKMLYNFLTMSFATSPVLYIGYGNQDWNWDLVLSEVTKEMEPLPLPNSFRVSPGTPDYAKVIMEQKNITTIDGTLGEFVTSARASITPYDVSTAMLDEVKASVPRDLEAAFEESPRPTTKLLSSWVYANSAPFNTRANTRNFFRGEKPNWGLIAKNIPFERDIEGELFDEIVNYAGAGTPRARGVIVLGPAGYGITTLLMHLTTQIVKEGIGPVFWLKDVQSIDFEDIRFAISSFTEKVIFVVDNASMCSSLLQDIIHKLRERGETGLFLLGSRLNEWKQTTKRPYCNEILMERLSKQEIERLLSCLEDNNQLGCLEQLPHSLRVIAIKKKYGKELLVAMREATQGEAFEAILEGEFERIASKTAQNAYLLSCCTYQFGSAIRESLLKEILGVEDKGFYEELDRTTAGVLNRECFNEYFGEYVLFPRHRVIAEIVWKRCSAGGSESYLRDLIEHMNLHYATDRYAFDNLVRSDDTVDSIQTLEGRKNFFDKACEKDPDSPFVRQHYSRMLLRADIVDAALLQIDTALGMNPHIRTLYHTKGIILQKLAMDTSNIEVARKIMTRSEKCFNDAISMKPRDSYSWHGLADLYKCWASKTDSETDRVRYIIKAEEVISKGLKEVSNRERLLVLSAKLSKMVGNDANYYTALERAFKESKGSVYSASVLGQAYLTAEKYDEAIELLEEVIDGEEIDWRVILLLAKAKLKKGASFGEVFSILKIGELDGIRDSQFVSYMAGSAFLNGDFTYANKIYKLALNYGVDAEGRKKAQFFPMDRDDTSLPLRLEGVIVKVSAGYSLIEVTGYPRAFLCPASKYSGSVLEEGDRVSFQIAFTATNPLAIIPEKAQ